MDEVLFHHLYLFLDVSIIVIHRGRDAKYQFLGIYGDFKHEFHGTRLEQAQSRLGVHLRPRANGTKEGGYRLGVGCFCREVVVVKKRPGIVEDEVTSQHVNSLMKKPLPWVGNVTEALRV